MPSDKERKSMPTDEAVEAIVLSMADITRSGGLPIGIRWHAPESKITVGGQTIGVQITIDTRDPDNARLELEHEGRGEETAETDPRARYAVRLAKTPQPFGGVRWWFICPETGRRAMKLYLPNGGPMFLSRQAYGLAYASQRKGDYDLLMRRGDRLWRAIGGEGQWCFMRAGDLPPKPKWMRWPTYTRKAVRLSNLSRQLISQSMASFSRLKANTERRLRRQQSRDLHGAPCRPTGRSKHAAGL
jgi:hypothetical protein